MSIRSLWTLALLAPVAALSVACDDKDDDDDDDDEDNEGRGGGGGGRWSGWGSDGDSTTSGPRDSDVTEGSEGTEDPSALWGSFDRYDDDGCSSSWDLSGSPTSCAGCDYAFDVVATLSLDTCGALSDFSGLLSFEGSRAYLDSEYIGEWMGSEGYLSWDSSAATDRGDISARYWGFVEW
jgi:hypothetical protein